MIDEQYTNPNVFDHDAQPICRYKNIAIIAAGFTDSSNT